MCEISDMFEKKFGQGDSVMIIETSENCKITKWGFPKNEEDDIILIN